MHGKVPWQRIVWLQMPIVLRLKKKKSCWDILPADKEQWGNRELHMGDYESCLQVVHSSSAHSPLARTRSHGHAQQKARLECGEGWWPGWRGADLLSIPLGSVLGHICLQLWPIKVLFWSLLIYALLLLKFLFIKHFFYCTVSLLLCADYL